VQRRIAKLTKKWREAERQKDEALVYARSIKDERDSLNKKYSTLETTSLKVREEKLKSSLEAAKAKLAAARDAGDINALNLMLNKKLQKLVMRQQDCKSLNQWQKVNLNK
jgi:hypothetical protein